MGFSELLILAGLCLASLVSGRLLTGALGLDPFRRLEPTSAAATAILGTAVWTLGSLWLSLVGLPAPQAATVLAVLHLVPLAACVRRHRIDVLRPRGAPLLWVGLLGPGAMAGIVALLPVLRTNGFWSGNDTYTYCAFSEWLQGHGFGTPCPWEPRSPVTYIPWLYQQHGYPLGIAHLVGLVQAATGADSALLVYPAVSSWGMVLQVWAVFLVARSLLRLSSVWASTASLIFAVVPHPIYWGHHNGFLQQTHALPVVLLGLVVLARTTREGCWKPATAALLALLIAFLVNVYLPALPLFIAAAVPWAWLGAVRARRRRALRRWAVFVGTTAVLSLALALADPREVGARFLGMTEAVPGRHIGFSAAEFLQFAMGTRVLGLHGSDVEVPPLTVINRGLTPLYLALAVGGFYRCARRPRTMGIVALACLLAAATGYYTVFVRDPWTRGLGHTWSVFKLMQWSYPVVLLLQAAGLAGLGRSLAAARPFVLSFIVALPLSLLTVQWSWSESLGRQLRDLIASERPLDEVKRLVPRFQGLPRGTLLVVSRPANRHPWLAAHVALLAYPRPIVGDWTNSAAVLVHPEDAGRTYAGLLARIGERARLGEEDAVPLLCGFTPFQPGGFEDLGGGLARLIPADRPLVVQVLNPAGLEQDPDSGRPIFRMGAGRTKVVVWSPLDLHAELLLSLAAYESAGAGGDANLAVFQVQGDHEHRAVRQAAEGIPLAVAPLDGAREVSVPLPLPRGLATVVLQPSSALSLTVEGLAIQRARDR